MATKPPRRAPPHNPVAHNGNNSSVLKVHQGPLPDPQTLREYDDLIPGAAAEIIKMASDQASHRRSLEKASQDSDSAARDKQIEIERERIRGSLCTEQMGIILGWVIAAFCVGAAIWSAVADKSAVVTVAFLGLPIAGIINAIRKKA